MLSVLYARSFTKDNNYQVSFLSCNITIIGYVKEDVKKQSKNNWGNSDSLFKNTENL